MKFINQSLQTAVFISNNFNGYSRFMVVLLFVGILINRKYKIWREHGFQLTPLLLGSRWKRCYSK